jgi:hypothetical protein
MCLGLNVWILGFVEIIPLIVTTGKSPKQGGLSETLD